METHGLGRPLPSVHNGIGHTVFMGGIAACSRYGDIVVMGCGYMQITASGVGFVTITGSTVCVIRALKLYNTSAILMSRAISLICVFCR
jgi:hypothetical protein